MNKVEYRYSIVYLFAYATAILYLHFVFQTSFTGFLSAFLGFGAGLSLLAWMLTRKLQYPFQRPAAGNENWILAGLVLWIVFYISYGGNLINKIFPGEWISNDRIYAIIVFTRKLFVFVFVPYLVYRSLGFSGSDFGFGKGRVKLFSRQFAVIFFTVSAAVLLLQFYLGNGSKPVREGQFSRSQLSIGLPFCFIYLLFDAGLIEEFFFRGLLQSRLQVLLRSKAGGILISAIIFGLVHAPGLYLRGAGSEGIEEKLPFLFFAAYTVAYMSIAGIFLGIIYSRTKSIWLVMAIHAMVDLFPNLKEFVNTWHI